MNVRAILTYVMVIAVLGLGTYVYYDYSMRNEGMAVPSPMASTGKVQVKSEPSLTEEDVKGIVRDFIMTNPGLIIEAVEKMQMEKAQESMERIADLIKAKQGELENNPNDPRVGNKDSKIKIVEWFDYACGYCKRMIPIKQKLMEQNPDIEFVFKEFPILGQASVVASKAALAVYLADSSKYMDFHNALLKHRGTKNAAAMQELAQKVGVNAESYKAALNDPKVGQTLEANRKLAMEIGIQGTPAYIIAGELIPGALSLKEFQARINKLKESMKPAEKPKAQEKAVEKPVVEKTPSVPEINADNVPPAPAAPEVPQ